jgi:hypothetical protein
MHIQAGLGSIDFQQEGAKKVQGRLTTCWQVWGVLTTCWQVWGGLTTCQQVQGGLTTTAGMFVRIDYLPAGAGRVDYHCTGMFGRIDYIHMLTVGNKILLLDACM